MSADLRVTEKRLEGALNAKGPMTANRRRHLQRLAQNVVRDMTKLPRAVERILKQRPLISRQRVVHKAIPEIAAAAFSDAFAGTLVVSVLRNHGSHKYVEQYLRAMRAELESLEARWAAARRAKRPA